MKIIWVARPAEGGILQHLQQLSAGIPDLDITLAAPRSLQAAFEGRRFITLDLEDGLDFRRDLVSIFRLQRILKREKAGVVHAHGLKAALIASSALVAAPNSRFFYTAHNALPQGSGVLGRWWYELRLRRLFQGMDAIISVSEAVRSQILRFVPETRVQTIYNGISSAKFAAFLPQESRSTQGLTMDDHVVGTVARLIPAKGIATLLEAVSLVAKILPRLHVVVVGDGPERTRLEQYAHALGLNGRVHFLGWRNDVPGLMAGWNCFALPSLSEGFNFSVLEAMASRLPVVVSDLPALREAVVPNRGGLLVIPGNAPELAAALLHLLKTPEKAKAMGEFNLRRVQTLFGEEKMVGAVRALYEGLKI